MASGKFPVLNIVVVEDVQAELDRSGLCQGFVDVYLHLVAESFRVLEGLVGLLLLEAMEGLEEGMGAALDGVHAVEERGEVFIGELGGGAVAGVARG